MTKSGARPPHFFFMAGSTFMVVMGIAILAPVLSRLAALYHLSDLQAGLLLSSFAVGQLAFSLPGGLLSTRFGCRSACLGGSLLTGTCALAAAFAPNFPVLLLAQLGQGLGSALFNVAAMAWVVSVVPSKAAGRMIGEYQASVLLGISFSPVIGGISAILLGVKGPFLVYACAAFTAAAIIAVVQTSARVIPVEGFGQGQARALLTNRAFLLALTSCLLYFWALSGVRNTLVPLFAVSELGLTEVSVGILLGVTGLAQVMMLWGAGRLVDRVGRRPIIRWSIAALAASVAALALVHDPPVLFAVMLGVGFVSGIAAVAPMAVLFDVARENARGLAVGIQRTVSSMGHTLGPVVLGGVAGATDYRPAFGFAGLVLLAGALVVGRIPETGATRNATQGTHP